MPLLTYFMTWEGLEQGLAKLPHSRFLTLDLKHKGLARATLVKSLPSYSFVEKQLNQIAPECFPIISCNSERLTTLKLRQRVRPTRTNIVNVCHYFPSHMTAYLLFDLIGARPTS